MRDDTREVSEVDRFMSRTAAGDGCWEWGGCIDADGYGVAWVFGKRRLAHRAAYLLFKGPLPQHMCVLHHCDNPRCVRPSHLFLGTQADNVADCVSKGRTQHHGRGGSHILTAAQVARIKEQMRDGARNTDLALEYGVAKNTVSHIRLGDTWRMVS